MIASATLFDLLGSKVLASLQFTKTEITEEFLQTAISEYYSLIEENTAQEFITTKIGNTAVSILKVGDVTVLVVIGASDSFSEDEIATIKKLDWHVTDEIEQSSVREFKDSFVELAEQHLRIPLNVCLITVEEPPPEDTTASAIELMIRNKGASRTVLSKPIRIGPYNVCVSHFFYDEIINRKWVDDWSSYHVFAVVVSGVLSEANRVEDVVQKIRSHGDEKIIVIPGSDEELEHARDIETNLGIELCDSVSPRPTHLLLSIMAYGGFIDIHPELARQK